MNSSKTTIAFQDFEKCHIHVGTVTDAELNERARDSAYVLTIDFGREIGVKRSSAQIAEYYSREELPGTQILAVTNFAPKRVAGVSSEVLVLAAVNAAGHAVLVRSTRFVESGSRISWLRQWCVSKCPLLGLSGH